MTALRANMRCDLCDWTMPDQVVTEWHNVSCPSCNASVIVNDEDMALADIMQAFINTGRVMVGGPPAPNESVLLVDTAPMREQQAPDVRIVDGEATVSA